MEQQGLPAVSQTQINNHKAKVVGRRGTLIQLLTMIMLGVAEVKVDDQPVGVALAFMDQLDDYIDEAFKERERVRRGDPAWGIED